MPAITACTVSGTCRDTSGTAISGITIKASCERPFIHPTDSSLIMNYEVTTTTATDGTWSLVLVETATPVVTLNISFYYPLGSNATSDRKDYSIIVPNQASATFASLISSVTEV